MSDEHMNEGMSVQPKLYELGYLLAPLIASESLESETAKLKEIIGEVKAEGSPKMQRLAYTISKKIGSNRHDFDDAYFGWIKFETTPEQMSEIKKKLDQFEMVVRYLLINTELTEADLNPEMGEEGESEGEVADEAASPEEKPKAKEEKQEDGDDDERIDQEIDELLDRGEL